MIRSFTGRWKGLCMVDDQDPDLSYKWYRSWPDESEVRLEYFGDEEGRQYCLSEWHEVIVDPDLLMDIGL
jgi:hypothetical protein